MKSKEEIDIDEIFHWAIQEHVSVTGVPDDWPLATNRRPDYENYEDVAKKTFK